MSGPDNTELRSMVRDLAKRRDSIDRRQLYYALVQTEVWVPVSVQSSVGHVQPGDLHPLDREALGGLASFGFFTHEAAAKTWQGEEGEGIALRLERIAFAELLPLLLNAGAGSAYINPASKFSGEFYRHELETMHEGARALARRKLSAQHTPAPPPESESSAESEESKPSIWKRMAEWFQ